jgi:hypothetical protein
MAGESFILSSETPRILQSGKLEQKKGAQIGVVTSGNYR